MVKNLKPRAFTLIGILALALVIGVLAVTPQVPSSEASRTSSPDGTIVAGLMQTPADANGARGFKGCFQRPGSSSPTTATCNEVAYLAGVVAGGSAVPVSLVWPTPSEFEIRYANATSVHIYKPVFTWGSVRLNRGGSRYGSRLPIFVKAVQTAHESPQDSTGAPTQGQ